MYILLWAQVETDLIKRLCFDQLSVFEVYKYDLFFFCLSEKLLDICVSMLQIYELTNLLWSSKIQNLYNKPTAHRCYFLNVKADPLHEFHLQDSELSASVYV